MPEPTRQYRRDIAATFAGQYDATSLAALSVPVPVVCGSAGPNVTHRIAERLVGALGNGEKTDLAGAAHAMLATHPDEIAGTIRGVAARHA